VIDTTLVESALQQEQIPVIGSIIQDSTNERHFFVYVSVSRDGRDRQHPSNGLLKKIEEDLKTQGVTLEFFLSDNKSQDVEGGLRATLLHSFGQDIRNVFLSIDKKSARVWLDPKRELTSATLTAIQEKTKIYFKEVDLELSSLLTTSNEGLPGKIACLKAMRQLSPVSLADLHAELIRREFSIPSEDWLRRRLDVLRKNGLIVRMADSNYSLSQLALAKLGTKKTRDSPDVSKLLALARKSG